MADLFDEILKQASNNTKDASKELKKIDKSVEHERRLKAVREAQERRLIKETIKKNAPPPPPKPKFCIPKLSARKAEPSVDKERIAAFLKKKEEEKRKEFIEKRNEKEKLIKLRLQSYGGKANKKLAKQFGTTPIELQQKYGTDREHEEYLKKLQIREEEEADRLNTELRGSVMKALERKKVADKLAPSAEERKAKGPYRVASNKQNSLRYFTKEDSPGPTTSSSKNKSDEKTKRFSGTGKKTTGIAGRIEKRKPPPAFDFMDLMKKAEAIQRGESVSLTDSPTYTKKDQPGTSERCFGEKVTGRIKNGQDQLLKKTGNRSIGNSEQVNNAKKSLINKYSIGTVKRASESLSGSSSNKGRLEKSSGCSAKESYRTSNTAGNTRIESKQFISTRTGAEQTSSPAPTRRYLPGDVRYKPEMNQSKGSSASLSRSASLSQKSSIRPSVRSSLSSSSLVRSGTSTVTGRDRTAQKTDARIMPKIGADRKRTEDSRSKCDPTTLKKSRFDAEEYKEFIRYKMRQEELRRRCEEEMEDEEYDSDMDSFIDDSEFDELSRKDFEETLRMVNPRYNKKKWALNERMIDDRYMEAKYRDVAREEMRSAKIGLLEDLREAQRGTSFAL
uniref:Protein SPT2 homolog n=1 Tax=Syphacia muris TaxID=451379 RepID=A0A158R638_9BILA